jgi:hypothetical protein
MIIHGHENNLSAKYIQDPISNKIQSASATLYVKHQGGVTRCDEPQYPPSIIGGDHKYHLLKEEKYKGSAPRPAAPPPVYLGLTVRRIDGLSHVVDWEIIDFEHVWLWWRNEARDS